VKFLSFQAAAVVVEPRRLVEFLELELVLEVISI
jgi:hypothetical protein